MKVVSDISYKWNFSPEQKQLPVLGQYGWDTEAKEIEFDNGYVISFLPTITPDYVRWSWQAGGPDGYFIDEGEFFADALAIVQRDIAARG